MSNGVKFLGHSVHPILIVFPLGLLSAATIFDVINVFRPGDGIATAAYWMLASGLIGGVLAAIFGWLDWFPIESGTRAKRIGLIHGLTNATGLVIFAASFYLRMDTPTRPPMLATILAVVGVVLALVGGWLGGELVERLGIGVHPGANVNAPSSLSTEIISGDAVIMKKANAEK